MLVPQPQIELFCICTVLTIDQPEREREPLPPTDLVDDFLLSVK